VLLRRGAPGWRVYGMRAPFGDGIITIDFEQAAGALGEIGEQLAGQLAAQFAEGMQGAFQDLQETWEQGGTPEQIAAERASFEALVAVGVDAHDAAWKVDVSGNLPVSLCSGYWVDVRKRRSRSTPAVSIANRWKSWQRKRNPTRTKAIPQ
jgi:hypothetical protein